MNSKKTSNFESLSLFRIWLIFFAYATLVAALVQLVIIPRFFPPGSVDQGLLIGGDSATFSSLAINLSQKIQIQGWGAWLLWPSGQGPAGVAAIFYTIFSPKPWVLIPFNAALHATSGIILILILELFVKERRIAFLSTLPFILFPSALLWYAQIHKDTYTIPGSLLFIMGWVMISRQATWGKVSEVISAIFFVLAGASLIWIMRPYEVEILQILVGVVSIAMFGLYLFWYLRKTWNLRLLIISSLVTFSLVAALTPFVQNTPTNNSTLSDLHPVAAVPLTKDWQTNSILPASIDQKARNYSETREHYLLVTGGSDIDTNVHFRSLTDIILYIPRGLQIGFLAPFPNMWLGQGTQLDGTLARRVSIFEMSLVYLGLIGSLFMFWRQKKKPEIWIIYFLSTCMILSYSMVVVNIGTLYRFRYPYLMTLVSFGIVMIIGVWDRAKINLNGRNFLLVMKKYFGQPQGIPQPEVYDTATHVHPAIDELKNISGYKYLIFQLVRRDILTRYKRSVLGVAWTMLNPLGTMLVLSIVFSQLFASSTPAYPLYILSGLMAWNFFAQSTNAAMSNMVWGGSLLNKIYIPRSSFALSAISTAMVNLILAIVPLLVVSLVLQVPVKITALYLPIPMILLACFSLGVGLLLSTMAIYFPDVAEMYQIVLTAWMYLTPIIYPEAIIPVNMQPYLRLNPLYFLVNLYRIPFYDGRIPVWAEFWPAAVWAVGILVLGWFIFTSKADEFAYRV